MKLLNRLRIGIGRRPKLPPGTEYRLDTKDVPGTCRVLETVYVVRAIPPDAAAGDMGQQIGPQFETFDRATAYRDWLAGDAVTFDWGQGPA